jgi:hypothetical protein
MANVYTTFATDQLAALTDGSERPTLPLNGGNVHTVQVTRTAYTPANADPLYLVRLPKGARVIANGCSVDHGIASSTSLTGDVGYIYDDGTGSANAYANDISLGTAAGAKQFHGAVGSANTAPVTLAAPAWIYVTWTASGAASHTQLWTITYTLG